MAKGTGLNRKYTGGRLVLCKHCGLKHEENSRIREAHQKLEKRK
jgi:hypothetical protein